MKRVNLEVGYGLTNGELEDFILSSPDCPEIKYLDKGDMPPKCVVNWLKRGRVDEPYYCPDCLGIKLYDVTRKPYCLCAFEEEAELI